MKNLLRSLFGRSPAPAADSLIKPGDCWRYPTRPGEEASYLVIRKLERHSKIGELVHISVLNVHMKNPNFHKGFHDTIGHMPVTRESLLPQLQEKVQREYPDADWEGGYATWKKENGGAFIIPIRDLVDMFEAAFNQPSAN